MRRLRALMGRLTGLLTRGRRERELAAELDSHLQLHIEDNLRSGMTPAEARRQALMALGGLEQTKELVRDARATFVDSVRQDVVFALRLMRRSPMVTLAAVLSLALGIGANTAVFSILNSLSLRSLPVGEPDRLVLLVEGDEATWSNPVWEQIRSRPGLFEAACATSPLRLDFAHGGLTEYVDGIWASGGFFDVLGVGTILGRPIGESDDRRGGGAEGPVVVISHGLWQRRFGGAPGVIGQTVMLSQTAFTIVGVMPPGFSGPYVGRATDVVAPIGTKPLVTGQFSLLDTPSAWLNVVGRLKPGQTAEAAAAALRGMQDQIRTATLPRGDTESQYLREPFAVRSAATGISDLRDRYQRPIVVLMAVVVMVLLIACANIASLLLSRASARRYELSVRWALGATRLRLARQFLTESLLLALAGAALGLVLANWCSALLVRQLSTSVSTVFLDLSLDWRVLGFTAAVTLATAVLFGMAPSTWATRVQTAEVLKEDPRSFVGERGVGLGQAMVVAEVALSLVLVVGALLFVRTFAAIATLDVGFDRDRVLVIYVNGLQAGIAPTDSSVFDRARQAVAALPGVAHASESAMTPVSGLDLNDTVEVPGGALLSGSDRVVRVNSVSPEYFATYDTPILAGRDFTDGDRAGTQPVAVVNEAFARRFLNGRDPVGQSIRRISESQATTQAPPIRIVGLVGDAVYGSLRDSVPPTMYRPLAQDRLPIPITVISVRAATDSPALLTRGVAEAIGRVNGLLALTIRPLAEQVNSTFLQERLLAMLSGFFGVLALLLAGLGLYGVTSHAVNRRRTEIGIRMALGAAPGRVVRTVLRRFVLLAALGVAIGGAASLWAAGLVESLLFGLEARDPLTFAGAASLLAAIVLVAGWLPARRAARIDPTTVLRGH